MISDGVAGPFANTSCPSGFDKIEQDLNEGTLTHDDFVFLCVSREVRIFAVMYTCHAVQGYVKGVNDVENILVAS